MQFRKMQEYGIHHLQDPKQVVFTSDQEPVVNGVLDGKFDVGFVRTDQLERTKDNVTGELIDRSLLKIINVIPNLTLDGVSFPFQSSTELYPEWNVASLVHVQDIVAEAVQIALLALNDYAIYGEALGACFIERNCTAENATCQNECYKITELECIPPPELALLSVKARMEGKYSGWRTTLSYMELRNMQEETGFISLDPFLGLKRCVRTEEIFEAIVCPEGHFRQREDQVLDGCKSSGLDCYGYQCLCKPCVKAFDVDVFPLLEENQVVTKGCDKFAICGSIVQGETIKFRAIDNKQRSNVVLKVKEYQGLSTVEKVILPLASKEINLNASNVHSNTFDFELSAEGKEVGSIIFEIYIGEEQIPQSPFRLLVTKPDCSDLGKEADASGKCVCLSNTLEISGNCVGSHIIVLSVIAPLFIILGSILLWYVDFKRRQADSVWIVKKKELKFHDPPEVVGRGTFGLVLLAEYRGTQVAVKRVIPPNPSGFSYQDSANDTKSFLDSGQTATSHVLNAEGNLNDAMAISSTRGDQETMGLSSGDAEVESIKTRQNRNVHNNADIAIVIDHCNDGNDYEKYYSKIPENSNNHRLNSVQFAPGQALVSIDSGQGEKFRSGSLTIDGKMKSKAAKIVEKILDAGGCRDVYADLKKDFVREMRHLSKLRHPCITTVMGAVIQRLEEPMLVMEYMEYGSLYDMLHNETFEIDGTFVLPILRDIAQGLRFLHAANPLVVHGDLKAQNILVDSKLRAKVIVTKKEDWSNWHSVMDGSRIVTR
jgi:Protein tyrosine and serine/threonine kinase/ABC transporter, phosphonate, periplasmic substrate-binding protein